MAHCTDPPNKKLTDNKVLHCEQSWLFSCIQRLQFLKPFKKTQQSRLLHLSIASAPISHIKKWLIHTFENCIPAFQPWTWNNIINVRNKPSSIWGEKGKFNTKTASNQNLDTSIHITGSNWRVSAKTNTQDQH